MISTIIVMDNSVMVTMYFMANRFSGSLNP